MRRLFGLALLAGGAYAAYSAWQRRTEPVPGGAPEWPPLTEDPRPAAPRTEPPAASPAPSPPASDRAAAPAIDTAGDTPTSESSRTWVEPVDGGCPDGFPIKANANSGIYHVPGGRFYNRTVPERCYADEASAEADGYRRAKA